MKNLKLIIFSLLSLLVMTTFSSCSTHNVPEGHMGLVIKRPYLFGSNGTEVVAPGRVILAWTSDIIDINVQQFKKDEQFNDLITQNKVPVDFKIY